MKVTEFETKFDVGDIVVLPNGALAKIRLVETVIAKNTTGTTIETWYNCLDSGGDWTYSCGAPLRFQNDDIYAINEINDFIKNTFNKDK